MIRTTAVLAFLSLISLPSSVESFSAHIEKYSAGGDGISIDVRIRLYEPAKITYRIGIPLDAIDIVSERLGLFVLFELRDTRGRGRAPEYEWPCVDVGYVPVPCSRSPHIQSGEAIITIRFVRQKIDSFLMLITQSPIKILVGRYGDTKPLVLNIDSAAFAQTWNDYRVNIKSK